MGEASHVTYRSVRDDILSTLHPVDADLNAFAPGHCYSQYPAPLAPHVPAAALAHRLWDLRQPKQAGIGSSSSESRPYGQVDANHSVQSTRMTHLRSYFLS